MCFDFFKTKDVECGGYIFKYTKPCIVEIEVSEIIMEFVGSSMILNLYDEGIKHQCICKVVGCDIEEKKLYLLHEREFIHPYSYVEIDSLF